MIVLPTFIGKPLLARILQYSGCSDYVDGPNPNLTISNRSCYFSAYLRHFTRISIVFLPVFGANSTLTVNLTLNPNPIPNIIGRNSFVYCQEIPDALYNTKMTFTFQNATTQLEVSPPNPNPLFQPWPLR